MCQDIFKRCTLKFTEVKRQCLGFSLKYLGKKEKVEVYVTHMVKSVMDKWGFVIFYLLLHILSNAIVDFPVT